MTQNGRTVTQLDVVDPEPVQSLVPLPGTMQAITRAEIESQVELAKRYPRSIGKFMRELETVATITVEVAEKCFYVLKRKDKRTGEVKRIEGKSIRFAEVAAGCYQNIRYGARVVDIGDQFVTVRGVGIDLERLVGVEQDVQRRITTSSGQRYGEDMIGVTIAAALSIAMRNVTLRLIPAAYTDEAYEKAKKVAVGNAQTLRDRRAKMLERFAQMGVTQEELLAWTEKTTLEDVGLEQIEDLIGLHNAIKDGTQNIDEAFGRIKAPGKPGDLAEGKQPFGFRKQTEEKKTEDKPESPAAPADPAKGEVQGADHSPPAGDPSKDPAGSEGFDAGLAAEARAREEAEARKEGPQSESDERRYLLVEIDSLQNKRKMSAVSRAGLWKQFCGASTREQATGEQLRKLLGHLRTVTGGQGNLV